MSVDEPPVTLLHEATTEEIFDEIERRFPTFLVVVFDRKDETLYHRRHGGGCFTLLGLLTTMREALLCDTLSVDEDEDDEEI